MHVCVVGGGIVGLASAYYLADRGASVTLLEKGTLGAGSTDRAVGGIRAQFSSPENVDLSLAAMAVWDDFEAEFGTAIEHRRPGYLFLARTEEVADALREAAEMQRDKGVPTETLSPADLGARWPALHTERYLVGTYSATDGFADPHLAVQGFSAAARETGVDIRTKTAVTDLPRKEGRVVGVETEYGPVDADHVVYATGWRTRDLLAEHVELPVRPMRWNAVVVEPTEPLPETCPLGSEGESRTYWRPTARGDVLIGGNEHLLADPEGTPMGVDGSFRDLVFEEVAPLLRGVAEGRLRREDCCPTADSASPDGLPIVDAPTEAPDGLVAVTGLHGRGVMLSPVVGRTVRSLVTGEAAPFPVDPLRLDRFEDRSADFEYLSHWD